MKDIAGKAGYFAGVTYEWGNQYDRAKRVYEWFLDKHPDSHWASLVRDHHLPNVEKELETARQSRTRRP